MLNEDKIRLMTKITMFEGKERRKIECANRYFLWDYTVRGLLRAFFGYTACFALLFGVWGLYNVEQIFNNFTLDTVFAIGGRAVWVYVVGLVCYLLIALVVAIARHQSAQRALVQYLGKLKHLEKRYGPKEQAKTAGKGGRSA
ncbi:MAG: hypothetical protein LBR77_05250 [Lachnospiraceae bacterium]|jgi:hypothetical protein|nr:hypothetical protein [Lachnospiraceae bacterium]